MATASLPNTIPASRFFAGPGEKSLLRFTTAGSVDDGKSTLIGRLLYDTKGAFEDQIEAIKKSKINRSSAAFDLSLLTDGLRAEREQGITIDVAYRYFATPKRKFIIADTPGHEQYTRNMATGASSADVAIILVDARKGMQPQSRRHAYISSLLGIRHLVVAVNKIDLVEFSQQVFEQIAGEFRAIAGELGNPLFHFIPVSALLGDNVVTRSANMPWYGGPSLLEFLETVEVDAATDEDPFRMQVQVVIRPHLDFRGFAGQISSGVIRPGDRVVAWPSGRESRVKEIVTFDGNLDYAVAPMSVTLTLEDELDISRGDILTTPEEAPTIARKVAGKLVWMSPEDLDLSKTYLLQHGSVVMNARVNRVDGVIDMNTLQTQASEGMRLNDIGRVEIESTRALTFDRYAANRRTGAFILVDALTNRTVAAGTIEGSLEEQRSKREASFRTHAVTAGERVVRFGHRPVWVRVGTEALAESLERNLFEQGCHVVRLRGAVGPLQALLDAGLLVITVGGDEEAGPLVDAASLELPADTEAATHRIVEHLRNMRLLLIEEEVSPGEGI